MTTIQITTTKCIVHQANNTAQINKNDKHHKQLQQNISNIQPIIIHKISIQTTTGDRIGYPTSNCS